MSEAQRLVPRCLTFDQRERYHLTSVPPRWCYFQKKWPYDDATVVNAFADAAANSVRSHIESRDYGAAIAELEQTIASMPGLAARFTPTLAETCNRFAWDAFLDVVLRGKSVESLRGVLPAADRAIALAPGNAAYIDTRGQILLALGDIDKAISDLDMAISLGLSSVGTWYSRGRAHELNGNRDTATTDYQKALAEPGSSDWAKHAQAQTRVRLQALGADQMLP